MFHYSTPIRGVEYCDEHVSLLVCVFVSLCVSVFVSTPVFGTTHPIFTIFCAFYLWLWLNPLALLQ